MDSHKRIFYFDALRLMAIIGIIFCHTAISFIALDIGSVNFYITAFMDCFREFCVPIFVMLSGALLIGKKDSLSSFFKRRLSRIFIPFIFWWIIYTLFSFYFLIYRIDWNYALDIFIGKGGTIGVAFWFIWMIIVVYIAVFIINKVISYGNLRIADFDKRFITLLSVLSVAYIIMYQMHLLPDVVYKNILGYYASFISYAIIGYSLAHNDFISSKISANKLAVITLTLSLATYIYYILYCVAPMSIASNSFTYLSYFNVLILVMSASIFLLFKSMSNMQFFKRIEESRYGDAIVTLSGYSYGIYLAHYLILNIIKRELIKYYDFTQQSPLICMPLLVMATFIISLGILMVLNRIPYLKKVTGK